MEKNTCRTTKATVYVTAITARPWATCPQKHGHMLSFTHLQVSIVFFAGKRHNAAWWVDGLVLLRLQHESLRSLRTPSTAKHPDYPHTLSFCIHPGWMYCTLSTEAHRLFLGLQSSNLSILDSAICTSHSKPNVSSKMQLHLTKVESYLVLQPTSITIIITTITSPLSATHHNHNIISSRTTIIMTSIITIK